MGEIGSTNLAIGCDLTWDLGTVNASDRGEQRIKIRGLPQHEARSSAGIIVVGNSVLWY